MSNSETPDSESIESKGWGTAPWICIVLAVLFLAAGGYAAYRDRPGSSTKEAWGNAGARGDYWGGHFAAASGLAGTLILFAALLLQGKELKLQRKELRDSREVAEQQAEALDEQTDELKAQNDNLKRQIGLTENRDETQLIMSVASDVQRLEDTIQDPTNITGLRGKALDVSQKRFIRFATRRIVLRFEVDRPNAEDNMQIFFARLPERLHEIGFKSLERAVFEYNPIPIADPKNGPVHTWVQDMKALITEELL